MQNLLEKNKIFLGDCLEIMSNLPENYIDLTVTSPPYNVAIKYDSHDDCMSEQAYFEFMQNVSDGLYRITKIGGRVCINIPFIGNSNFRKKSEQLVFYPNLYIPIFEKSGWIIRDFVVWVKTSEQENPNNFCGNSTQWGSWLSPSCPYMRCFSEVILVFHKEQKTLGHKGISDLDKDSFMEYTKNVWYFRAETQKKSHPAPFPVELPKRCIRLYSYIGDIIIDPFVGSGTTALACYELGRNYIGIELSAEYCEIAEKRVADAILARDSQPSLFEKVAD